jgi:serine protease AprX
MAAFSSRGPTDDGRVKPDIVAPGTNIVSNQSHYPNAGTLWGAHESNANYAYSGGTSMATPLAAGAGALVRQWLTTRGIANPSAAAVKAVLLNTAADIAPGQYGTGPTQEIPTARPNGVAGWGRADLGFLDAPAPFMQWADDHGAGLATGQSVEYTHSEARPLEVLNSDQPLRVMLAWSDPPASLSAAAQLVNDLDLAVIGPGGEEYHGNNVAAGDRINNVEGIVIDNPPVGRYSVRVRGHNVPVESQPYALAVAGPLTEVGQLTLTKRADPSSTVAPGGLITYTLSLTANQPVTQTTTLTDALPLHTTFVSASDGGTLAGGSVATWTITSLDAGMPVTRTLVVRVAGDVADDTPIVNASYRAGAGALLPGIGSPVSLAVKSQPSETDKKVYLPLMVR